MMGRSGQFIPTGGIRVFHPADLPPEPDIDLAALQPVLAEANIALGRVDSIVDFIPDPDLFVFMYIRKEAVLSSQIEGTQASLSDLLEYEADIPVRPYGGPRDVKEIANYVAAMNLGLDSLEELPLSMRLLKEVHGYLLPGTRGGNRAPGSVRKIQNWIGPEGSDAAHSVFVPPPPNELDDLLTNLELYFHRDDSLPAIVRAGVCHAQFETIHPFLDGNGRLGRLLVTLMLCERGVLRRPLLYLSAHFKQHKDTYYDWLNEVRETGNWEGWLRFFLEGVRDVANGACENARSVLSLQRELSERVSESSISGQNAFKLLGLLYKHPVLTVADAEKLLDTSFSTANSLVAQFEALGILAEITGRKRGRVFRFQPYLKCLQPT